jgi:hypothetical protein
LVHAGLPTVRDEADKAEHPGACVNELVPLAGGDEDDAAFLDWPLTLLGPHGTLSGEHKHFVLPGVLVMRRGATWLDFDDAHREGRGAIVFADDPPYSDSIDTLGGLSFNFSIISHQHGDLLPMKKCPRLLR